MRWTIRRSSLKNSLTQRSRRRKKRTSRKSLNSKRPFSKRLGQSPQTLTTTSQILRHRSKSAQSFSISSSRQATRKSVRCCRKPFHLQRQRQKNSPYPSPPKRTETAKRSNRCVKISESRFRRFKNGTGNSTKKRFKVQMRAKVRHTPNIRKFPTSILSHSKPPLRTKSMRFRAKSTHASLRLRLRLPKNRAMSKRRSPAWQNRSRIGFQISLVASKTNSTNCSRALSQNSTGSLRVSSSKSPICKKMSSPKSPICRTRLTQRSLICIQRLSRASRNCTAM